MTFRFMPRINFIGVFIVLLTSTLNCSSSENTSQAIQPKLTTHRHHMADKSPFKGHGKHGAMPHRFEDAEEWAKKFDDPKRDQWQLPDEVIKTLAIGPNMTVVDLGAGTGYFLPYLSKALAGTGQVIGADVETSMVQYMDKRIKESKLSNAKSQHVPPNDPKLKENTVDRVLVVDTWHHIQNRESYVAKLHKGLKKGAFVAIVDFNQKSPIGPPKQHRLTAEQVKEDFPPSFWQVKEVTTALPYQFVVIATKS